MVLEAAFLSKTRSPSYDKRMVGFEAAPSKSTCPWGESADIVFNFFLFHSNSIKNVTINDNFSSFWLGGAA